MDVAESYFWSYDLKLQTFIKNFLRMNSNDYDYLVKLVAPLITKKVTNFRDPISDSERLTVTLRYLATKESFRSIQHVFRIPHSTISGIFPEVSDALYKVLQPNYLEIRLTSEEWVTISNEFLQMWNFPNCIGALDGKHVVMTTPTHSGSVFFLTTKAHIVLSSWLLLMHPIRFIMKSFPF